MSILTVGSQKGGVGKTTTVLNLGYLLGRLGEQVLLVDADPQGGMSIASNVRRKSSIGLAQLLRCEATAAEVIARSREGSLSVAGSGVTTPEDAFLLEDAARDGRLSSAIGELASGFAWTLVDAPAGVGSITAALLEASDGVLLIVRARALLLKTLPVFLRLVQHVRQERNPRLKLEGALITMHDAGNSTERELIGEFSRDLPGSALFRATVPYDERYEAASIAARPVAMLADGREAARPYLALALELKERELLSRVGGRTDENDAGLF